MSKESPRGVIDKVLDYDLEVSEFEFESFYKVHFRTNTPGKGMNTLISPLSMS